MVWQVRYGQAGLGLAGKVEARYVGFWQVCLGVASLGMVWSGKVRYGKVNFN